MHCRKIEYGNSGATLWSLAWDKQIQTKGIRSGRKWGKESYARIFTDSIFHWWWSPRKFHYRKNNFIIPQISIYEERKTNDIDWRGSRVNRLVLFIAIIPMQTLFYLISWSNPLIRKKLLETPFTGTWINIVLLHRLIDATHAWRPFTISISARTLTADTFISWKFQV